VIKGAFMTLREILEAIRTLPRPDRLRLAAQLNRDLASAPALHGRSRDPPTHPYRGAAGLAIGGGRG
jgi:hypothetical protein